ncbi:hypothetical protein BHM03_00025791 [Ensete ventricosum]|nr:hypothetical protein BHM03_00025791 [Ensete ventricosum]
MTISAEGFHLAARPSSTSGIVKAVHSLNFFAVISPLFQSPKEQTHRFLIDNPDEAWLDEVGMVELSMGGNGSGRRWWCRHSPRALAVPTRVSKTLEQTDLENYEMVKDLGSGNFGVARLLRNKETKELVAIKYIPRGQKQICHRDLKLENTLLDGSPAPRLKICDFGYSKPHARVRAVTRYLLSTCAASVPRGWHRRHGDGCVLVASFGGCVGAPTEEIRNHPWFLKNLPRELTEAQQAQYYKRDTPTYSLQSVEEIMRIVGEARTPPPSSTPVAGFGWAEEEEEEEGKQDQQENNEEEEEDEYDKRVKEVHASGEYPLVD